MKSRRRCTLLLPVLLLVAAAQEKDVVLRAMHDELERSKALRVVELDKPYFLEYRLEDGENFRISASRGGLLGESHTRFRLPIIQVRVGDYKLDNGNYIGSDAPGGTAWDVGQFPLDDSYTVLRRHFWLGTDMVFKSALKALSRKRAVLQNLTLSENLPDFDKAEPFRLVLPPQHLKFEEAAWRERVRRLSAELNAFPEVFSNLDLLVSRNNRYLANNEGTELRIPEQVITLRAVAAAQAPDGMWVREAAFFNRLDWKALPPDAELTAALARLGGNVRALAKAPLGEAYSGPVLFEGAAGPQLLAQLLGKNLVLTRRPVAPQGTNAPMLTSEFDSRLNARILPEWMDVTDDPTQTQWQGQPLFGHYEVDLEGTPAKPLALVEKGVLKNFLLTRQPVKTYTASNGRARLPGVFGARLAGFGNLFVRASQTVKAAELRTRLMDLCKERNLPYGVIVRELDFPSVSSADELRRLVTGAVQSGSGARPLSPPVLVYKVFPDGREELVRGLRFRGVSARVLKDILAASEETYVLNFHDNTALFALTDGAGYTAETSVIAPALLVDDVEFERPPEDRPKLPLVPPPPASYPTP